MMADGCKIWGGELANRCDSRCCDVWHGDVLRGPSFSSLVGRKGSRKRLYSMKPRSNISLMVDGRWNGNWWLFFESWALPLTEGGRLSRYWLKIGMLDEVERKSRNTERVPNLSLSLAQSARESHTRDVIIVQKICVKSIRLCWQRGRVCAWACNYPKFRPSLSLTFFFWVRGMMCVAGSEWLVTRILEEESNLDEKFNKKNNFRLKPLSLVFKFDFHNNCKKNIEWFAVIRVRSMGCPYSGTLRSVE